MTGGVAGQKQAVVIGAGISGLASAALLAREGYRVTLLEARDQIGGRAGTWSQQGFTFDTGPSWYLMPEVFDHFFGLLGTSAAEQLDLVHLDPGYRVFFEDDAEPFDLPCSHADEKLMALEERPHRLKAYLDSAAQTYQLALESFLYTTFTSLRPFLSRRMLSRVPRLLRLLLQPLDRFIAGHAANPRVQKILGYPAVFLGTSPSAAPSMYHLMSHLAVNQGVLYPRGGFTAAVRAISDLAEAHGVTIRTGCRAERIITANGAVTGVEVAQTGSVSVQRAVVAADVVVSAVDLDITEHQLLQPDQRSLPQRRWSTGDPGPGAVLALLGVEGEVPQLAHHSLLFTANWEKDFAEIAGTAARVPGPRSLYVCRPSATDDGVAPAGSENLFVLIPVPADPAIGGGGTDCTGDPQVEQIVDEAITQIAEWSGADDLADRIVVRRSVGPADFAQEFGAWRGGALGPAHTLRQSAFLRGPVASRRVAGLFYAGATTMPGIGVPMCLISAELVLKQLRGDHSLGPLKEEW